MRRPVRHPYLNLAFTAAPLMFALVWSITHGRTLDAVIVAVAGTFYVSIALAVLVVWRRQRSNGGPGDPPAD